jgi:hypothetical protein
LNDSNFFYSLFNQDPLVTIQLLQSKLETAQAENRASQSKIETLQYKMERDALQFQVKYEGLEKEVLCISSFCYFFSHFYFLECQIEEEKSKFRGRNSKSQKRCRT